MSFQMNQTFPSGGAPLLDIVANDINIGPGWKTIPKEQLDYYQQNRGLKRTMATHVNLKEITIGKTPEEDIKRINEFIHHNYRQDFEKCPTGVIACDTEGIQVVAAKYHLLF